MTLSDNCSCVMGCDEQVATTAVMNCPVHGEDGEEATLVLAPEESARLAEILARTEGLVGRTLRYIVKARSGANSPDPESDLRIVAEGEHQGDWLGVALHPREGFEPDFRWLVTRAQIEDGRYMVVG